MVLKNLFDMEMHGIGYYLLFSLIISKRPWRNWFGNISSPIQWTTKFDLPSNATSLQWTAKTPPWNIKEFKQIKYSFLCQVSGQNKKMKIIGIINASVTFK